MITNYNKFTWLLAKEVLLESLENLIVKNIKAKANFDEYVSSKENKGELFSDSELDVLNNLDTQPYKILDDEIRFSATEETNNKNKVLAVVKKQGRYIVFFSVRNPVDVSPVKNIDDEEVDDRDDIIIKVSRPFKEGDTEDPSLLFNVINVLTKEYQI